MSELGYSIPQNYRIKCKLANLTLKGGEKKREKIANETYFLLNSSIQMVVLQKSVDSLKNYRR